MRQRPERDTDDNVEPSLIRRRKQHIADFDNLQSNLLPPLPADVAKHIRMDVQTEIDEVVKCSLAIGQTANIVKKSGKVRTTEFHVVISVNISDELAASVPFPRLASEPVTRESTASSTGVARVNCRARISRSQTGSNFFT